MASDPRDPHGGVGNDAADAAVPPPPQPRGSRVVPSARVAAVEHEGHTVLLDADAGRRMRLDPFGGRVWALLGDHPTMPALVAALREEGVRTEYLAQDVARLLTYWTRQGVVAWR